MVGNQLLVAVPAKKAFVCFQKSTPQKNLALTFEIFACLQKREKGQKLRKKRAQNHAVCAKIKILSHGFSPFFTGRSFPSVLKRPFFRQKLHRRRDLNFL